MAHDQFRIPVSPEAFTEGPALVETTPEIINWSQKVRDIEAGVEALRATADAATVARYRLDKLFGQTKIRPAVAPLRPVLKRFVGLPVAQDNVEKHLVQAESEIGGEIGPLPEGVLSKRFWFHGGDWVYEEVDAQGPAYSRYVLQGDQLLKLVNGHTVDLAPGEQAHFIEMTQQYYNKINEDLYRGESLPDTLQRAA